MTPSQVIFIFGDNRGSGGLIQAYNIFSSVQNVLCTHSSQHDAILSH